MKKEGLIRRKDGLEGRLTLKVLIEKAKKPRK